MTTSSMNGALTVGPVDNGMLAPGESHGSGGARGNRSALEREAAGGLREPDPAGLLRVVADLADGEDRLEAALALRRPELEDEVRQVLQLAQQAAVVDVGVERQQRL